MISQMGRDFLQRHWLLRGVRASYSQENYGFSSSLPSSMVFKMARSSIQVQSCISSTLHVMQLHVPHVGQIILELHVSQKTASLTKKSLRHFQHFICKCGFLGKNPNYTSRSHQCRCMHEKPWSWIALFTSSAEMTSESYSTLAASRK